MKRKNFDCRKRQAERKRMRRNKQNVTEEEQRSARKSHSKKGGLAKWIVLAVVLLVLVTVAALGLSYENETGLFSQKLQTSFFHLYSAKVPTGKNLRLVVLSDLHNKEFGTDNADLVKQVQKLEPDLILLAGDMVNKTEDRTDVAVTLCRQLVEIAPVYYGIGNHEGNMMYVNGLRIDGQLREVGVKVLINQSEDIVVQDTAVSVGSVSTSVSDYDEYSAPFTAEFEQKDTLKILIAHCPDLFYEKMAEVNVDLAVAGHFHGGQVQLPVVGGLYAIGQGFFPKYCNGMFTLANGHLFVTRGLGNSHTFPRINNRPEVAVIDINARKDGTTSVNE